MLNNRLDGSKMLSSSAEEKIGWRKGWREDRVVSW